MLLAQLVTHTGLSRYGFLGIHGLFGILLGLAIWLIILWGFWTIFGILQAQFGKPETSWMFQIIRVVITVIICIAFVQLIFNLFG
jgi:hypothetical protein